MNDHRIWIAVFRTDKEVPLRFRVYRMLMAAAALAAFVQAFGAPMKWS